MDEKLDVQGFSFVPLPRYKCSVRYNCFLFSHTWFYSKVNVFAAKKKLWVYYLFILHVFKYYFKYQVIINISATLQHESSMKFIYRGFSNILKCVVLEQSFYFVFKEEKELFSSV